jgi:hypothetical protein
MKTLANAIDIEPATRCISSLPGTVSLRCSDGFLIGYEVARQFESHPLRQRVFSFRDSLNYLSEKRAFGRNPAVKVHRRNDLVGFKREF